MTERKAPTARKAPGPKGPGFKSKVAAKAAAEFEAEAGFADTTVPSLSASLAQHPEIEAAEIERWLAPRLGNFRASTALAAAKTTSSDAVEYLARVVALSSELRDALAPDGIPWLADECIRSRAAPLAGVEWPEFRKNAQRQLALLRSIAVLAIDDAKRHPTARGRPPATSRDQLFADLIGRLRDESLTLKVATLLAKEILHACGISTPSVTAADGTKALTRAARRGQK